MNILLITSERITGINYHRLLIPHIHLKNSYEGYDVTKTVSSNLLTDEQLKEYQVVIISRIADESTNNDSLGVIKRLKSCGCKVVVDTDDYWKLHNKHEMNPMYLANDTTNQMVDTLRAADWVTCTTPHFADKIKEINPNVTVLPNSMYAAAPQFIPSPKDNDRVRIGWIGGVFHKEDLALVHNGFNEVWKGIKHDKFQLCLGGWNYPDSNKLQYLKDVLSKPMPQQVRTIFTNYMNMIVAGQDVPREYIFRKEFGNEQQYDLIEGYMTGFGKYPIDTEYREYLEFRTPNGNDISIDKPYRRLPSKSAEEYATMYNDIDISLVPLINNNFNSFKSQIKIIEAGWFKKAVIVSNVMPYTLDCNNRNSILVSPSKRGYGWGTAMKSLILNPNKREDLAEELHEHVTANYNMDVVNKVRHDLYQRLCQ